jgi:hypothetical protein
MSEVTILRVVESGKENSYKLLQGNILDSGEITNKMQPCNRIYYSTVY